MCRLLAWGATEPISVADALGDGELDRFKQLSLKHADGWGMACIEDGEHAPPRVVRSTLAAAGDPVFDATMHSLRSRLGFVHLRWATPGLPVVERNTHPFVSGEWAFAHNGAIHPQDGLDELVPAAWLRRMTGTTDSERYFLAVLSCMADGMGVRDAIAATVTDIFSRFEPTGLNAMLLGPEALFIVSAFDPVRIPRFEDEENRGLPPDVVAYDLHQRRAGNAIVVASSGLGQSRDTGWEHLPNMTLLRIDRATLHVTVESLETGAAVP